HEDPMRRSLISVAVLATGLGAVRWAHAAEVDFHIIDQSVVVDRPAGTATFTLTFDRQPDFIAIDHGQGQAFQYEVDVDSTSFDRPIDWSDIDTVIRGGELFEGRGLPVRDRDGADGGPDSGGWGPVRALLP